MNPTGRHLYRSHPLENHQDWTFEQRITSLISTSTLQSQSCVTIVLYAGGFGWNDHIGIGRPQVERSRLQGLGLLGDGRTPCHGSTLRPIASSLLHVPTTHGSVCSPAPGSGPLSVFLHGVEDEADVGEVVERTENEKCKST